MIARTSENACESDVNKYLHRKADVNLNILSFLFSFWNNDFKELYWLGGITVCVFGEKDFWVSILIIIMVVTLTLLLLYFHGKSNKEAEPEEWHMIDDGVYFNVYTEDTKGQETTGIFENITSDTVFYASIQNSGQERYVKLACYLNYERVSIEMLNSSYDNDQILLEDKDNITIPFKLKVK